MDINLKEKRPRPSIDNIIVLSVSLLLMHLWCQLVLKLNMSNNGNKGKMKGYDHDKRVYIHFFLRGGYIH